MTLNQLKYVITLSKVNSINEAAKILFISQPSLTSALKALEEELGFDIFLRSKSGISLTVKGSEFLGYAKSVVEQYDILDSKYISQNTAKRSFQVSMQHYTFAVNAFVEVIKQYGMDEYEFEIHETKTHEVIDNVKNQKSELGVLYLDNYNKTVLSKIINDSNLEFVPLFDCNIYVYMSKNNPLAKKKIIKMEELDDYPCLAFAQGDYNSFYFAEEVLSTYNYKRLVRANDRATLLNLMVGIDGYTLCSGIICEDLNGTDYCAVKLDTEEKMTIGYIMRKSSVLSEIGRKYIDELSKYRDKVLA
ncbi:MAG: LysR family transcriptional regulator [Lachnospiraceae bacterium]|nr:LysR family transcriptional regulator [Candidatus Merdinaster equi]